MEESELIEYRGKFDSASFPVVLGDFVCHVTCQACRENSYCARFQASSGHSDSANRPGYEAEFDSSLAGNWSEAS